MRTSDPEAQHRLFEGHWQRLVALSPEARSRALALVRADDPLLAARLQRQLARRALLDAGDEPFEPATAARPRDGDARDAAGRVRRWRRVAMRCVVPVVVVAVIAIALVATMRGRAAARDAATQRAVGAFAFSLLAAPTDPSMPEAAAAAARDATLAQLDRAARRAMQTLAATPATQRIVLSRLARAYLDLGRAREALPLAERAVALARGDRTDDAALRGALAQHVRALTALGQLDAAWVASRERVASTAARFGGDDRRTLRARRDEAIVLHARGAYAPARAAFVAIDAIGRRDASATAGDRDALLHAWANLERDAGDPERSLSLYRERDARAARGGADAPVALASAGDHGAALLALGRVDEAAPLVARGVAEARRRFGDDSAAFATQLHHAATLRLARGEARTALALLRDAIALAERTLGAAHPDTARLRIDAGHASLALGDFTAARDAFDDAEGVLAAVGDGGHPARAAALAGRAAARWRLGDPHGAALDLRAAIALRERDVGIAHPYTLVLVEARDALRGVAAMPRVAASQAAWFEVRRVRAAWRMSPRG